VQFVRGGHEFTALNGGPEFKFNKVLSFLVLMPMKKLHIATFQMTYEKPDSELFRPWCQRSLRLLLLLRTSLSRRG
jgi:hypothetical protein